MANPPHQNITCIDSVDVSEIFYFFLFGGGGRGRGSPGQQGGGGSVFSIENPRGGGSLMRGGARGLGGCLQGLGGGALFSGPKCPPSRTFLRELISAHYITLMELIASRDFTRRGSMFPV